MNSQTRLRLALPILSLILPFTAYAAESPFDLPEWMSNQSNDDQCVVGVAQADVAGHAEQAHYTALLEIGMQDLVKVESQLKTISENTGISKRLQLSRFTRLLAQTSNQKVTEKTNWVSRSGDYFSLVCVSEEGQSTEQTIGLVKAFTEENKVNASAAVKRSISLKISGKASISDNATFSLVGDKQQLLEDVLAEVKNLEILTEDNEDSFVHGVAVKTVVRGEKLAEAYLQSMVTARSKLAEKFNHKINSPGAQSKDVADQNLVDGTAKVLTEVVLSDTAVERVYYDRIEEVLYILMSHRFTVEDVEKARQRIVQASR